LRRLVSVVLGFIKETFRYFIYCRTYVSLDEWTGELCSFWVSTFRIIFVSFLYFFVI
jgi:hypothetical protein